jgi:hypothetical protein
MDHHPILAALANAEASSGMDGRDLSAASKASSQVSMREAVLIANYSSHWDYFHSEWPWPECRGVRIGRHTYVKWLSGKEELFDSAYFLNAEAIAEAVDRENMRFVPIKTDDQLDLQALHRVRERLVSRRTSVINQVRAFLLERGVTFRKGPATLRAQLPEILENADEQLSTRLRSLLAMLWEEWKELERKIESLNNDIERICASDAACQRLQQIPGIGPLVGSALVATAWARLQAGRRLFVQRTQNDCSESHEHSDVHRMG